MIGKVYDMAIDLLNEYKINPNPITAQSFDYTIDFLAKLEETNRCSVIIELMERIKIKGI